VLGASLGIGRATVQALSAEGVRVVAVARGAEALASLRAELASVQTLQADVSDAGTASRLLRELRPDFVVLAAGIRPHMAALTEQTWETFSAAWTSDTRAAFHLLQAALTTPLAPGSMVVVVSSGAAIGGSPLSGGYAGAKRMQWLLTGYAQKLADRRQLGLRFVTVLPHQLVAGTEIGANAAEAYGAWQGSSGAQLLAAYEKPLTASGVATAIVRCLRGEFAPSVAAVTVTGAGATALG